MKTLIYFFIIFNFCIINLHALEIDEKLTIRFLKVSATKKTILINRGAEDGVAVGNHAKFFTTNGVVARGVVEKVSPSRSIWSLYRIIDATEISDDKVLNLKIASPVKISEDSTKSLKDEIIPSGTDKILVETPNMETHEVDSFETDGEIAIQPIKEKHIMTNSTSSRKWQTPVDMQVSTKQWELWGNLTANMLSGNATDINSGTTSATRKSTSSTLDLSAGVEKYFFKSSGILKQISLTGFIHSKSATLGDDIQVSEKLMEYGLGLRYHFDPIVNVNYKIMPFLLADIGVGTVTLTNTVTSTNQTVDPSVGSSSFMAFGGGLKYFLDNGLGFRSIVDYYTANETYPYVDKTGTRTLAGLRFQAGISYRFY